MTTRTTHTLTAAERTYLQAAVRCMQAVEAEACANIPSPASTFADVTFRDACLVSRITGICPLDHEQAADLLCLIGDAADVELHVPADPAIDDEPMGLEAAFVDAAAAAVCRP